VEEMTKTPEELAEEFSKVNAGTDVGALGCYRQGLYEGYLAGYQAAAPQWILVKDRLPEYENDYLLAFRIKDFRDRLIEVDRFWFGHRGWDVPNSYEVLAWMPLPAAPREEV
jgi:hypothetical protein